MTTPIILRLGSTQKFVEKAPFSVIGALLARSR